MTLSLPAVPFPASAASADSGPATAAEDSVVS